MKMAVTVKSRGTARPEDVLAIPDHIRVVALFPVGYPDQNPAQRPRKSIDQIACFEKYE
ncbi:MAG: hypothetical protein WC601_06385 [Desulfotomaculaceae bacterium]